MMTLGAWLIAYSIFVENEEGSEVLDEDCVYVSADFDEETAIKVVNEARFWLEGFPADAQFAVSSITRESIKVIASETYATIGFGQFYDGQPGCGYVRLIAPDYGAARKLIFEQTNGKFCTTYDSMGSMHRNDKRLLGELVDSSLNLADYQRVEYYDGHCQERILYIKGE